MQDIKEFLGPHRWLSNFWPAPVLMDGETYPTVEHAYQAAKRLGGFVTKRDDWDMIKLEVMRRLLLQKFAIPEMRQKLLDTGDARIIEGNTWGDTFWGVCRGNGTNHLGRLIEDIREQANAQAI